MANIEVNNRNEGKKSKPKRSILRVDFTPMVDMNMLLITFFMFCTTLSIPQVMKIAMPTDEGGEQLSPASKSVTVILGEEDKIFYYEGLADFTDYTSLKEISISGLRNTLLDRNAYIVTKMRNLRRQLANKELTDTQYKDQLTEIKKSKDGLNVLIKPTKDSNYRNLVDVLDEMHICGIDRYTIIDIEKADEFLMENLKTKGQMTAMSDIK
ncbi:MAG: biopolymer transporter ExbD [Prevotella sp.]|jgi:biopolymer transport protein ExbD|nr:biopolymer transporter ExbD [Prevotella sp.]